METLRTKVNKNTPEFRENYEFNKTLKEELVSHLTKVSEGGGEKSVKRHRSRLILSSWRPELIAVQSS